MSRRLERAGGRTTNCSLCFATYHTMLRDDKIARVKGRIDKSRNVRLGKLKGEVAKRIQQKYRSADLLPKQ